MRAEGGRSKHHRETGMESTRSERIELMARDMPDKRTQTYLLHATAWVMVGWLLAWRWSLWMGSDACFSNSYPQVEGLNPSTLPPSLPPSFVIPIPPSITLHTVHSHHVVPRHVLGCGTHWHLRLKHHQAHLHGAMHQETTDSRRNEGKQTERQGNEVLPYKTNVTFF